MIPKHTQPARPAKWGRLRSATPAVFPPSRATDQLWYARSVTGKFPDATRGMRPDFHPARNVVCSVVTGLRRPLFTPELASFLGAGSVFPKVMSSSSPLPMEFSWLSPATRPSTREIETYAHIINAVERHPPERLAEAVREAELQLWVWRNESHGSRDGPRRRRSHAGASPRRGEPVGAT